MSAGSIIARFRRGLRGSEELRLVDGPPGQLILGVWYLGDDGEWHPSRRSVTIRLRERAELGEMLTALDRPRLPPGPKAEGEIAPMALTQPEIAPMRLTRAGGSR